MLAQNFMTAEQLGIDEDLHWALIKVLGMLERGEIKARPKKVGKILLDGYNELSLTPMFFDMGPRWAYYDCGTACCMLGLADSVAIRERRSYDRWRGDTIKALFLPKGDARFCRDPKAGAAALRSYLTTGDPKWDEALDDHAR